LYDFVRISSGPYKGAYCHDLFIKDQPALCKLMRRNKIKGSGAIAMTSAEYPYAPKK
jgi:hypothetical protein